MPPNDDELIESILDEISALSSTKTEEPEELAFQGAKQSLYRENTNANHATTSDLPDREEFASLLKHSHNQPHPEYDSPSTRTFFNLGFGFIQGLRATKQISARLQAKLLKELHLQVAMAPPTPKRELLVDIFAQTSEPSRKLLRQRAELIQILRNQKHPNWLKIRQALYQPDTFSEEEASSYRKEAKLALSQEDLKMLTNVGNE